MYLRGFQRLSSFLFLSSIISGCVFIPQGREYVPPPERPSEVEAYYSQKDSFLNFEEELISSGEITVKRIYIATKIGPITVDYFQRGNAHDELIFVLPILGGKNTLADYFAKYFAERGYDTAVVHRSSDFKDPENFPRIEQVLRENVIRDRIAIDFFEEVYQKKRFGTFGLSRGAINAAITAGVDKRLKYNVLAMGGSDLSELFEDSDEGGIERYRARVKSYFELTDKNFFDYLDREVKTDPKYVAKYIDAENTLLFLSLFDRSVPLKYGARLRKRIGRPETVVLLSGHYTAIAYTQLVSVGNDDVSIPLFPFDYVETEALAFYNKKFERQSFSFKAGVYKVLQAPVSYVIKLFDAIM